MLQTRERSTQHKIWRAFSQDKIVLSSLIFLVLMYGTILISGFLAPYSEEYSDRDLAYAPPTPIFILDEGKPSWPFVVTYTRKFDPVTYGFGFYPDYSKKYPIHLFTKGEKYKLLGFIPCDIHLFGVNAPARIFLLGTDLNGRDNLSRIFYGGQISLTIGFLGLFIAFPIGLLYGGISGYFGGRVDNVMMRFAEIIMSIPSFYLLISLAAILPPGLSSRERFALIVAILAFIGWAGISRIIRGMVLSLKEMEYVEAARSLGASSARIIVQHLIPQTATYFIIAATLGVPGYLLAESGLSFLGLGIQPPDASWGNMLREAQDLTNIMLRPWLLLGPGLLIFLTILSFNVVGDKLRDILDPKSHGKAT
jgi:peptide/nickel transport system permease protein